MPIAQYAAVAAAPLVALTLGACEKPSPGVTIFSGGDSIRQEALCWSESARDCAADLVEDAGTLDPADNVLVADTWATVGISVDNSVADKGWIVRFGGQALVNEPITTTYYRFPMLPTQLAPTGIPLEVVATDGETLDGLWRFRLSPRNP